MLRLTIVEIGVGGVGEQHHSEGQLGQGAQPGGAEVEPNHPEAVRPESQACRRKRDRPLTHDRSTRPAIAL